MDDADISEVKKAQTKNKFRICFICEKNQAKYHIKGIPNDGYCKDCAEDKFGSIDYLTEYE